MARSYIRHSMNRKWSQNGIFSLVSNQSPLFAEVFIRFFFLLFFFLSLFCRVVSIFLFFGLAHPRCSNNNELFILIISNPKIVCNRSFCMIRTFFFLFRFAFYFLFFQILIVRWIRLIKPICVCLFVLWIPIQQKPLEFQRSIFRFLCRYAKQPRKNISHMWAFGWNYNQFSTRML